jgi:hypothetical protein
MNESIVRSLVSLFAMLAGGAAGVLFGALQNAASLRNRKRNQRDGLGGGFSILAGSFARVATLLIALVSIQVVCPILFVGSTQWLVSVGVILGYGWMLLEQLRSHSAKHS